MLQQEQKVKQNYFLIPGSKASHNKDHAVIAVIDSSGSMSSCWKHMVTEWNKLIQGQQNVYCICFDTKPRRLDGPQLLESINQYGGGGTDICCGFEAMLQIFDDTKLPSEVTIIFISDGEDTSGAQKFKDKLKALTPKLQDIKNTYKIQFICVGVGKGFPTFIGMHFREHLHNGNDSLPPVFQVLEDNYAANFQEQFQILDKCLQHSEAISLNPPLQTYPWSDDLVAASFDGKILCSKSDELICTFCDGTSVQVLPLQMTADTIMECGRQWLQSLMLCSFKKNVSHDANLALNEFQQMPDNYLQIQDKNKKKLTVLERLMIKSNSLNQAQFTELINQFKKLSQSEMLSSLTPEEAAKRLAIGTKVGKYHKTALRFCGISVEDYRVMRDEMVSILESNKIDFEHSSQEQSVISMQNQKDILGEKDLVTALKQCPSQYDLVEILALIGQSVQVRRFDGGLVNPWLNEVIDVARHHKTIDTISIQLAKDKELTVNTGDGDIEKINAVLPLYDDKDKDLIPFLKTRLFGVLMTFNLLQNADCCYDTSLAALMANTLLFLIKLDQSEWRNQLIQRIVTTFQMKYDEEEEFVNMQKTMLGETPELALVNDHPNVPHRCEDATKALINLFYLLNTRTQEIAPNLEKIVNRIITEVIGREYPTTLQLRSLFTYEKPQQVDDDEKKLINSITQTLKKNIYNSYNELKKAIVDETEIQYSKIDYNLNIKLQLENIKFLHHKYSIEVLDKIYRFFLGKPLEYEQIICFLYHASENTNSYKRNKQPIEMDVNKVLKVIEKEIVKEIGPLRKIRTEIFQTLKGFVKQVDSHFCITPISRQELIDKGYDPIAYKYDSRTNITRKACLCQSCPCYLMYDDNFRVHYNSYITANYRIFGLIKKMKDEDPYKILDLFQNGSVHRSITKFATFQEDDCLIMIQHLQASYIDLANKKDF